MGALVTDTTNQHVTELLNFLQWEVQQRGLPITLYLADYLLLGRQVKIPAYVGGDYDAVQKANMLQTVEDTWNDRDPEPVLIATLMPATQPRTNGTK